MAAGAWPDPRPDPQPDLQPGLEVIRGKAAGWPAKLACPHAQTARRKPPWARIQAQPS